MSILALSLFLATAGAPAEPSPATFDAWMSNYLVTSEMNLPAYERAAIAITRMYRAAPGAAVYSPLAAILDDPNSPVWGYCGASAWLYTQIVSEYGYSVQRIDHAANFNRVHGVSGHVALNVSGPGLDKPIYLDPLYGYWIRDARGERVGAIDAMLALDNGDTASVERTVPYAAAVGGHETFNALPDYHGRIYGKYWRLVDFSSWDYSKHVFFVRDSALIDEGYMRELMTRPGRDLTFYHLSSAEP